MSDHQHYWTLLQRKHWWSLLPTPRCRCGAWLPSIQEMLRDLESGAS